MVSTRLTDEVGRVVNGRYRLVAPLGAGSSAQVFLAEDVDLGRQVAVKMLKPALADDERFLRRFRIEAQTVAAISHPNVVVIHDWGEDDVPYLVSEYLAGGSLRAIIDAGNDGGPLLTPSQALLVGLDVCRGLAHAHNAGLVHRDLKPANLLFDTEGRLRIADFGLARAIAEASVTEPEGAVMGTARYAAPEQARGERLDGRSDVYSLAVLLVEAVTGVAPFASDTTLGTLMARVDRDLEVPAALGPLRPALERAGRLHADDRPDAEEFGIMLLAASERLPAPDPLPLVGALAEADRSAGAPAEADRTMTLLPLIDPDDVTPETKSSPTPAADRDGDDAAPDAERPARSRRWLWAVAAVLLVALGAGGFFLAQELRTPTHAVPDLLGRQIDDIELIAEENDWVVDEKKTRRDGTEVGQIVSTEPPAGEQLAEGGTLVVVVSEGNTLTDVPTDIGDRPLDEVEALFVAAELEISTTETFDEEIPSGNVIGLDGEVDARLPKGEVVPLVVSQGPAPRTVPDIPDGATYADVEKLLADVQLVAARAEDFSDEVEAEQVIGLSEPPGTELARGSTVTVEVSKGPDVVDVPPTEGMTLDEAQAALEQAGLVLGEFVGGGGNRTVVASDPAAGQTVPRGTEVNLLLGR